MQVNLVNRLTTINILKKTIVALLLIYLQSCVIDRADLKINITNLSKNKIYVGSLSGDCDSCEIKRDIGFQCSNRNSDPPMIRTINAKDSVHLVDKLISSSVKMYVINADSLDEYCNKGSKYNIMNKQWVKVLSEKIDVEKKTCTITIR